MLTNMLKTPKTWLSSELVFKVVTRESEHSTKHCAHSLKHQLTMFKKWTGTNIFFYSTMWWFFFNCILGREQTLEWCDGECSLPASPAHCQRAQLSYQSTVRLGVTLQAALVTSSVRNSIVLRVLELIHSRGCPCQYLPLCSQRELIWEQSVVILIPGRENVIRGEQSYFSCSYQALTCPSCGCSSTAPRQAV